MDSASRCSYARQVLKPGLVKGQWGGEEDDRLVSLVERGFRNWGQVSVRFGSPPVSASDWAYTTRRKLTPDLPIYYRQYDML